MARPKLEITDEICQKAESFASKGLTMEQIAQVLGMGERTLYEKAKKHEQLSQAIKKGRAKGIAIIANKLFEKASSGDTTSIIFYLKNRDRESWGERPIEREPQGINLVVNRPKSGD
jgi:hypothetical protein